MVTCVLHGDCGEQVVNAPAMPMQHNAAYILEVLASFIQSTHGQQHQQLLVNHMVKHATSFWGDPACRSLSLSSGSMT